MLLACAAVGIIWGVTNVLMKVTTGTASSAAKPAGASATDGWSLGALLRNWKYLASLATNQSASVLFLWSLSGASLSVAVPLTNTVTFLTTSIAGRVLNNEQLSATTLAAMALMSTGIYLCVSA